MSTQMIEEQTAAAWGDYGSAGAWSPVVDELKRVDTWLAATLRTNDRIMEQLRYCNVPTEGDEHDCESAAVARVIVRDTSVDEHDGEACEFEGDMHPEIGLWLVCERHLQATSAYPVDGIELVAVEMLS